MVSIRRAGVDDLPVLCEMGRALREEAVVAFPELSEKEWRKMIDAMGDKYFMALALGGNGMPVGFVTALQNRFVFSTEPHIAQDTLYVRPESRGGRAALLLVRAVEGWARELGIGTVFLNVRSGLKQDATGRFFEKLDYQFMGCNYSKDLA